MSNIYIWLEEACRPIRYGPDRDAAYRELKDHFQDHYEYLKDQGMLHNAAQEKALEAMGDPAETRKLLAAAYRPVLTLLWRISRMLLVCLTIAIVTSGVIRMTQGQTREWFFGKAPEEEILQSFDFYKKKDSEVSITEGRSYLTAELGEFEFSITKALKCQWQISDDPEGIYHFIVVILKAKGPLMLKTPPDLHYYATAMDDKGTFYDSVWLSRDGTPEQKSVAMNRSFKRWGDCYYCAQISQTDPDVQWIDLNYDHMGQSFSLRVVFDQEASK